MAGREDLGSWLQGGPGEQRRPQDGQGGQDGRASLGRRVVALVVDWTLAQTVSWAFFTDRAAASEGPVAVFLDANPVATLVVFALSTVVLVGTAGATIGHRLLGLRVTRLADVGTTGRAPGLVPALARTVLLCLVVPPVVWDASGRGLHDVVAGTAIVRR